MTLLAFSLLFLNDPTGLLRAYLILVPLMFIAAWASIRFNGRF